MSKFVISQTKAIICFFALFVFGIAKAQNNSIDTAYYHGYGANNTVYGGLVLADSNILLFGTFTQLNDRNLNGDQKVA
jgi:hypothetical protein